MNGAIVVTSCDVVDKDAMGGGKCLDSSTPICRCALINWGTITSSAVSRVVFATGLKIGASDMQSCQ